MKLPKRNDELVEELVDRYLSGDMSVRDELIVQHLRLAKALADKAGYRNPFWRDGYEEIAMIALVEAVDRFPGCAYNNNIGGYIRATINQALMNETSNAFVIKVSKDTYRRRGKIVECVSLSDVFLEYDMDVLEFRELVDLACKTDEDRLIFQYFLTGLTLTEVGGLIGRSASYVYARKNILLDRFYYYWSL